MMTLLESLQQQGYSITFASPACDSEHIADLRQLNIDKVSIKVNDASFDEFIHHLMPDAVLFDRFMMEEQFGWRIEQHCPNALRLLQTVDLHCLRAARQEAVKNQRTLNTADYFSDIAKREIASILRCDLSLMISEFEIELLTNVYNVDKKLLHHLPFMVENIDESHQQSLLSFSERQDFISIGNFRHQPNWDAVLQLKNELWPAISQQIPQAKMLIFGAYMPPKAEQLNNEKQRFHVLGRAENVESVMQQARVCLAPLRFGAGIKGKLLDAMLAGTPSVTTPVGAESMHGNLPWNGAICDDNNNFINQAITLYNQPSLWHQAQSNGFTVINQCYDKTRHSRQLAERLAALNANLEQYRQSNFLGAMLKHHHLKSTEYMSRWIEAKNR